MKLLAWIGDKIWVYLIPLLIVSSTLSMGPGEWVLVGVGMIAVIFIALLLLFLMWLIQVPARLIERRFETPKPDV
jgi:hypothetical protein